MKSPMAITALNGIRILPSLSFSSSNFSVYALVSNVVYATTSGIPSIVQDGVYGAGGYGCFFSNMGETIT